MASRSTVRRLCAGLALACALLAAIAAPASAAPRPTAVILLHLAEAPENQAGSYYTHQTIREQVFGLAPAHPFSVREYWRTQTYGIVDLQGVLDPANGDVFGSYAVTTPGGAASGCQFHQWSHSAEEQAVADGFDPSRYQTVVFVLDSQRCSFAGIAGTGTQAWINGLNPVTINHELGHTFGSGHAASLRCRDGGGNVVPLSDTCDPADEYGDPLDQMGHGATYVQTQYVSHEMAPFRKVMIGAIPAADVPVVNTPGTYHLNPLEVSTGIRGIRLPTGRSDGRVFDLYVRRPIGPFDGNLTRDPGGNLAAINGVTVGLNPGDRASGEATWLLDMTPETPGGPIDPWTHQPTSGFEDAPLAVGRSFSDATTGLTLTVNSVDDTGATVTVAYGAGAVDVASPTIPGTPTASVAGGTITLSWPASSDAVGVTRYVVSRSGTLLPDVTGTGATDAPGAGTFAYTVRAADAAGNLSPASTPATVTIAGPAAGVTPPPAATPPATPPPALRPVVKRCKVPNLAGKTLAKARTALTKAGCRVGRIVRANHPRIARGRVISQGTRAGRLVLRGMAVRIVLSKGPRPVTRRAR